MMKLHSVDKNLSCTIKLSLDEKREFLKLWHYHPEHELVYIQSGRGTLYTGDYIGPYKPNDIFYFGKNLPHMFDSLTQEDDNFMISRSYALHIDESILQNIDIFSSEFSYLNQLFANSNKGFKFQINNNHEILDLLKGMLNLDSRENTIYYFLIMLKLFKSKAGKTLCSESWVKQYDTSNKRLNKVVQYIMLNFQQNITLEEIAEVSGMNKSAFCRYFKSQTGNSFIGYLNNLRISFACKMLKETNPEKSISETCYHSGFNSISYFTRTFKNIKNVSPSEYREKFLHQGNIH